MSTMSSRAKHKHAATNPGDSIAPQVEQMPTHSTPVLDHEEGREKALPDRLWKD